jgi:hypothetical protein
MLVLHANGEPPGDLRGALTHHVSFDKDLTADFSKGDKVAYYRKGKEIEPAVLNEEVKIVESEGRFGGALWFPKKGTSRPQYKNAKVLNYHEKNWNASVSVWLRLDPNKDLEPGYCDPVQIVGDDTKKGFIFLEWSKDHSPRYFRYAIRPLIHIWDPGSVGWEAIPAAKRPMVQLERAPFSRESWTHVVFTLQNINDKGGKPLGRLYMNGDLKGTIENWDLTFAWDPAQVALVLGAAYIGHMDDLAVFNRALTSVEVKKLYGLKDGVKELHP